MTSLTSHLLKIDPALFESATKHPFLSQAATSSLPIQQLKSWLAQDRLYALAYVNFMGAMLAQIPVPSTLDREKTLEWRITDALIDCLDNIRREIRMFEDTAAEEGWLEEIAPADGLEPTVETRAYHDLFAGATAQGRPLIVGLVILWATEECYMHAWKYSASLIDSSSKEAEKDVMQRVFIPNWSSDEFEAFVKRLRDLVDEAGRDLQPGSRWWKECEVAFRQCLWCERNFFKLGEEQGSDQ